MLSKTEQTISDLNDYLQWCKDYGFDENCFSTFDYFLSEELPLLKRSHKVLKHQ